MRSGPEPPSFRVVSRRRLVVFIVFPVAGWTMLRTEAAHRAATFSVLAAKVKVEHEAK